ncbi:hypothetical protein [Muricoccus nepalensis]|uniref:hypothetical protein n=1 Tax=Muricoccus nepalensis TaxID=1854500 RepID=UPI0013A5454F|nr:hypothetical protein [Roseomonas nepalensis]
MSGRSGVFLAAAIGLAIAGTPAQAWTPGELLYPGEGIDKNIDRMEAALRTLIDQFGKTVDEATLRALQRGMMAVQSTRSALSDVLTQAANSVSNERRALMVQLEAQILEVEKTVKDVSNQLGESEQRVTHTLQEITRSSQAPWVLEYEPRLYRSDLSSPVRVTVRGQNLADPRNRVIVGTHQIAPSISLANTATFSVPRDMLRPDVDGFAPIVLRTHATSRSFWSWLPWASTPAPLEVSLALRSMGSVVGHYELEFRSTTVASYVVHDQSYSVASPASGAERCIDSLPGEEFDTGFVQITITKNLRTTPAPPLSLAMVWPPAPQPPVTGPGPATAVAMGFASPEKICFVMHTPPPAGGSSQIDFTVKYRVKIHAAEGPLQRRSGALPWDKDTSEVLPPGVEGFLARVRFSGSERNIERVFEKSRTYGPLNLTYEPGSRAVVFRPLPVD